MSYWITEPTIIRISELPERARTPEVPLRPAGCEIIFNVKGLDRLSQRLKGLKRDLVPFFNQSVKNVAERQLRFIVEKKMEERGVPTHLLVIDPVEEIEPEKKLVGLHSFGRDNLKDPKKGFLLKFFECGTRKMPPRYFIRDSLPVLALGIASSILLKLKRKYGGRFLYRPRMPRMMI